MKKIFFLIISCISFQLLNAQIPGDAFPLTCRMISSGSRRPALAMVVSDKWELRSIYKVLGDSATAAADHLLNMRRDVTNIMS